MNIFLEILKPIYFVAVSLIITLLIQSYEACKLRDSGQLVCGTDGVTYPNSCELLRAHIRDPTIVAYNLGACEDSPSVLIADDSSAEKSPEEKYPYNPPHRIVLPKSKTRNRIRTDYTPKRTLKNPIRGKSDNIYSTYTQHGEEDGPQALNPISPQYKGWLRSLVEKLYTDRNRLTINSQGAVKITNSNNKQKYPVRTKNYEYLKTLENKKKNRHQTLSSRNNSGAVNSIYVKSYYHSGSPKKKPKNNIIQYDKYHNPINTENYQEYLKANIYHNLAQANERDQIQSYKYNTYGTYNKSEQGSPYRSENDRLDYYDDDETEDKWQKMFIIIDRKVKSKKKSDGQDQAKPKVTTYPPLPYGDDTRGLTRNHPLYQNYHINALLNGPVKARNQQRYRTTKDDKRKKVADIKLHFSEPTDNLESISHNYQAHEVYNTF